MDLRIAGGPTQRGVRASVVGHNDMYPGDCNGARRRLFNNLRPRSRRLPCPNTFSSSIALDEVLLQTEEANGQQVCFAGEGGKSSQDAGSRRCRSSAKARHKPALVICLANGCMAD